MMNNIIFFPSTDEKREKNCGKKRSVTIDKTREEANELTNKEWF